jgi:hypothetical protein
MQTHEHKTMKVIGPRTFIELRVGDFQSVEVVIHVRRADISWFNGTISHEKVVCGTIGKTDAQTIFTQVLDLIQTSILPRMFADEIEKNYYACIGKSPQPDLGPGGIPVIVPKSIASDTAKKTYNSKRQRISKIKQAEMKRLEQEAARQQRQDEKDIYYATNVDNTVQVAYRMEALSKFGHATLVFQRQEQSQIAKLVSFKKLQRRILIWCYPVNEIDNQNSFDVALTYNHDMIPASTCM